MRRNDREVGQLDGNEKLQRYSSTGHRKELSGARTYTPILVQRRLPRRGKSPFSLVPSLALEQGLSREESSNQYGRQNELIEPDSTEYDSGFTLEVNLLEHRVPTSHDGRENHT